MAFTKLRLYAGWLILLCASTFSGAGIAYIFFFALFTDFIIRAKSLQANLAAYSKGLGLKEQPPGSPGGSLFFGFSVFHVNKPVGLQRFFDMFGR